MNLRKTTRAAALGLAAAVLFTGCSNISPNATVVNIDNGKDSISLGYANFVAHYEQAYYDINYASYYGSDMWTQEISDDETMEDSVKESVMDEMEETYILRQHAADYGVEISDEEEAAIGAAAKQFIADNKNSAMEQMGATEEYVAEYLRNQWYARHVEDAINEAAENEITVTDEEAAQKTFTYVFASIDGETDEEGFSEELSDEEKQEQYNFLKVLIDDENLETDAESRGFTVSTESYGSLDLQAARDYEDYLSEEIDLSAETEDEDSDDEDDEDDDEEDEEVDERADYDGLDYKILAAADKLKKGEFSDIIETDDGYYLVRMDKLNDKEATEEAKETILQERKDDYYEELIDDWKDAITWDVNKRNWAKVRFIDRFEATDTEG